MSKTQSKKVLKKLKDIGKLWHPESTLVFKSSKNKVVIGRYFEGELLPLDDEALTLCDHWKFKYDESLVEEEEVEESEGEVEKSSEKEEEEVEKSIENEEEEVEKSIENEEEDSFEETRKRIKQEFNRVFVDAENYVYELQNKLRNREEELEDTRRKLTETEEKLRGIRNCLGMN